MMPPRSILIFTIGLLLLLSPSSLPFIEAAEQKQYFAIDGKVLELEESNLAATISTFDYMLVDFYASWCSHCKRLSPESQCPGHLAHTSTNFRGTGRLPPAIYQVMHLDAEKEMMSQCVALLEKFIVAREPNILYLGLNIHIRGCSAAKP